MDAGTRSSEAVITDAPQLADIWLEAAPALGAFLRSRGCSPQDADDLVQECAIRVLRSRPTFADTADLLRWCLPVVRNLSVDLHRKGRREVSVEVMPDRPAVGDVANDVVVALELRRVLQALQQLRPSDREAIVAHVGPEQSSSALDRRQAVRRNVQLHRARQRLLARLAAVLGICAALGRRMGRAATPAALPLALAVALLTTVLGGTAGRSGSSSAPGHTRVVRAGESSPASHRVPASQLPPRRRPAAVQVALHPRATRRPSEKATVVAVTTPEGVTARLAAGKARQPGTFVCVRDAEPLPDVCIPQPRPEATPRGSRL